MTSRTPTTWDFETHLIKPGMPCPRMVCLSTADNKGSQLYTRDEGLDVSERLVREEFSNGQHLFFDLGVLAAERPRVLPDIFRALDDGRIHCTKIRQMMIENCRGQLKFEFNEETLEYKKQNFSLDRLVQRHLGYDIAHKKKGGNVWRMRYSELDGVPLDQWPQEARDYPLEDSTQTHGIWLSQESEVAPEGIPGLESQMQAAWGLYLMGTWGCRTDPEMVEQYEDDLKGEFVEYTKVCREHGLRRDDGSRNMKAIRAEIEKWYRDHNRQMKLTATGQIATDREQLTTTDHPGLNAVAESVRTEKLLTTYVAALKRGTVVPLNPKYNPIIETFRTSCSGGMKIDGVPVGMNVQNLPRKGKVRECIIPRPGWRFAFCDFDTLEMRTLAQTCLDLFGYSFIADAIKAGRDLHVDFAADMLGMNYERAMALHLAGDPEIKNARQFCFHPDTEALTPSGWKKIEDLTESDYVAAAIPEDGDIRLEWQRPTALSRRVADQGLVHLKTEGIDLRVTPEHRMLAIRGDGTPEVTTPLEMPKKRGWWNTGKAPGGEWEPDEKLLRLAVATQADGSISYHQITFGFTKQRKIDRMRTLLEGFAHDERTTSKGVILFVIHGNNTYPSGRQTPKGPAEDIGALLSNKQFDQRWLKLSSRSRQIVLDEVQHWDATCTGRMVSFRYLNMNKRSAEIVQIIATLEGRKTRLTQEKPSGIWALSIRNHPIRKNDRSRGDNLIAKKIEYEGDVVCLSVPSTFVLVRDGGIPVVTGNCKISNYGMAGGMGPHAFVDYAKNMGGLIVTLDQAKALHRGFRNKWREMNDYFAHCAFLCSEGNAKHIVFPSGLVRGDVNYTATCNGFFQHLAAMGAKAALYQVSKECYTDAGSPLFGCRPWLFAHDEIGMEIPYEALGPRRSHAAAMRLQEVMIEQMRIWVPSVPIGATVAMTGRWYKGAEPLFVDGLLVPVKPRGREWVTDA